MDDMNGWEVATKIRALGWISTPIVMVSANAFENDPELLEQFRCQAFLVKPVSDSQLLLALEKFLGIEWKESEKPLIDVNPAALHSLTKLPDHVVADLLKMLRIGHVRGLLSLLDDISSSNPDYSSSCAQFRQLVMRFDLEKMEIALQQQMEG